MADLASLATFLRTHLSILEYDGGGGSGLQFPEFDLTPVEYLEFAELALTEGTTTSSDAKKSAALLNCVSHLKRATECQLDTFLHLMGLPKGRNFPDKMTSLRALGVVSSRSLEQLNRLRNQIEHDYSEPRIDNLELYFELVSAFVYAVDGFALLLSNYAEQTWRGPGEHARVYLDINYNAEHPSVRYVYGAPGSQAVTLEIGSSEGDEWTKAVRWFFLLSRSVCLASPDFVLGRLERLP